MSRDLSGVETQQMLVKPTDLPIRFGPVFTVDWTSSEETRSASLRNPSLPALAGRVVSSSYWPLPSYT
ncbi:MAG: hypothetical protein ACK449_15130 [Planctomycetota bacterium]